MNTDQLSLASREDKPADVEDWQKLASLGSPTVNVMERRQNHTRPPKPDRQIVSFVLLKRI